MLIILCLYLTICKCCIYFLHLGLNFFCILSFSVWRFSICFVRIYPQVLYILMLSQVVFVAASLQAGLKCPFSAGIHALVSTPCNTHTLLPGLCDYQDMAKWRAPLLRVRAVKATLAFFFLALSWIACSGKYENSSTWRSSGVKGRSQEELKASTNKPWMSDLKVDPPDPVEPSDDRSPGQHLDCNLLRDAEPGDLLNLLPGSRLVETVR